MQQALRSFLGYVARGRIEEERSHLPELQGEAYSRAACALFAHKAYGRCLKTYQRSNPILDGERIAPDARLDGKFLIQTLDYALLPEDVALGYKQLFEVEDAFKSLNVRYNQRGKASSPPDLMELYNYRWLIEKNRYLSSPQAREAYYVRELEAAA